MRSLLRASLGPPVDVAHLTRLAREEEAALERRGSRRHRSRLWVLAGLALASAPIGLLSVPGRSLVLDGLVHGRVQTLCAPGRVRVEQVFVAAGAQCVAGDPLLRLAALDGRNERVALELAVEQERVRLELVRAGGGLGHVDLGSREAEIDAARLDVDRAEEDVRAYELRRQQVGAERDALATELTTLAGEETARAAALAERRKAAEALAEAARKSLEFVRSELRRFEQLHASGIVSLQEVAHVEARIAEAEGALDGASGEVSALALELEAHRQAAERRLAAMRARMDELGLEAGAGEEAARAAARTLAERRERLTNLGAGAGAARVDRAALRSLEVALLENEVALSERRLAQFDEEHGHGILHAPSSGIVDRLLVGGSEAVESGAPLLSYLDARTVGVTAYVESEDCARLAPGMRCRIQPEGSAESLAGRVESLAGALVPRPAALARRREDRGFVLPVQIRLDARPPAGTLHPDRRVRVVLERDQPPR